MTKDWIEFILKCGIIGFILSLFIICIAKPMMRIWLEEISDFITNKIIKQSKKEENDKE